MKTSKTIWIVFTLLIFCFTTKSSYGQILASPTLQSPSNGASDQPTALTLNWNGVTGATSYRVQVSTSQNFNNLVVDQDGITGTSLDISGLDYETTYYWRVRATNGVTTSDWSDVWSFSTMLPPPQAPVLNSPSDGASDVPTDPTFSWNPVQNADTYQIQVATDTEFSSRAVNENGLTSASYQAAGLSTSTVYYWRVRATNAGGTGNWSATRSFTTTSSSGGSEPPVHPTLTSPSNGSSGVSTGPTLAWNSVQNADDYRLQLATDSDFSSTVIDENSITTTSLQVEGLSNSTTYYWRVLASNENGSSDWSSTWSFTTESSPPNPPEAPSPASPADGANGISTSPNFQWNSSQGADTYQLQVAANANFSSPAVNQSGLSSTSYQTSGLDNSTTYYWRVRASNEDGNSPWSEEWSFTTQDQPQSPPGTPELVAPSNESTGINTSPILDWNPAERAEKYRVQLAEDSGFSSLVTDSSEISATELQIQSLNNSTTYYWRAQASNSDGTGDWSSAWNFTTESSESREAPPPPQHVSPENGAEDISTTPFLDWDPSEGAGTYDLQIATDRNFQSAVVSLQDVTSTHYEADLDGSTTYYWRARARNDNGNSQWSDPWSFSTQSEGSAITIVEPDTKALWQAPDTHTIRWNATNQVSTVRLEYSSDDGESWNLISEQIDADENVYGWEVPNLSSVYTKIKITDEANPDNFAISPAFIIYPNSLQLNHNYSFPSSPSQSDYKLMALPAQTNIPLEQIFSGSYGNDWKAYHDNGNPENYLEEYTQTEQFAFESGQGFWVVSKGNIQVAEEAPPVQLDSDTTYTIPLHEGWNIISNPFHIPVNWEAVQTENNLGDPIWGFAGGFTENSIFEPYKGYYFFNRNNRAELTIPFEPEVASKQRSATAKANNRKIVSLSIYRHGEEKSTIRFGIDPSVVQNPDRRYQPAPPGDFQKYKLTLQPTKHEDTPYYLAEIRRSSVDEMVNLMVHFKSVPGESITLRAKGLDKLLPHQVALIHRQTGETFYLSKEKPIHTGFDKPHNEFRIVVGTPEEIEQQQQDSQPKTLTLSQNYPNPFNGQTVIKYGVPNEMGQTKVNLEVFDILGRKVYTLVNTQRQPGIYEVRWNGENETGRPLASGVYYYRLRVGQSVVTKKLTLIK